jgi:hypothetical protein
MPWSTVHIMYVYVTAACLDGNTIIAASEVRVVNADLFGILQVYSISVGTVLRR